MTSTAEKASSTAVHIPAFVIAYSDSDFTNPHEAALPDDPKDCRGDFTHMGAKYWGYETRRHKATTVDSNQKALLYDHDAHNWLTVGLKERAEITEVRISTKWYTGNQVRAASVFLKDEMTGKETKVLDRVSLAPDSEHSFPIPATIATECHIDFYYEGGMSRVGLFGHKTAEQPPNRKNLLEDVPITHVSNVHYGNPGMAVKGVRAEMHMVGWESARTGFGEQALFHLAKPTIIEEVVVDTYLHRLNAPLTCHAFAANVAQGEDIDKLVEKAPRWKLVFGNGKEVIPDHFQTYMLEQKYLNESVPDPKHFKILLHHEKGSPWKPVVTFAALHPDRYHRFTDIEEKGPFTHFLYWHYPNGGIHGLKLFGKEQ